MLSSTSASSLVKFPLSVLLAGPLSVTVGVTDEVDADIEELPAADEVEADIEVLPSADVGVTVAVAVPAVPVDATGDEDPDGVFVPFIGLLVEGASLH